MFRAVFLVAQPRAGQAARAKEGSVSPAARMRRVMFCGLIGGGAPPRATSASFPTGGSLIASWPPARALVLYFTHRSAGIAHGDGPTRRQLRHGSVKMACLPMRRHRMWAWPLGQDPHTRRSRVHRLPNSSRRSGGTLDPFDSEPFTEGPPVSRVCHKLRDGNQEGCLLVR